MSGLWLPDKYRQSATAKELCRQKIAEKMEPVYSRDPSQAEKAADYVFTEAQRVMQAEDAWVDKWMKRIMPPAIYDQRETSPPTAARWLMENGVRMECRGMQRSLFQVVDGKEVLLGVFNVKAVKGRSNA